ncbi:MAG TPA: hypothetical protein VMA83_04560 [Solirubrobacteraceae bacterium]|nr:hypothetical protein [Solirubrobacteraceae bacterium]
MLSSLRRRAASEDGFTLVELLVTTTMAIVLCLGAYALLDFTGEDIARTTSRVHVDQRGRVSLEAIMEHLHSACVASLVTPVLASSSGTVLRFISEASESPTISTATLHKLIYETGKKSTEGKLIEDSWKSLASSVAPHYSFNEAEKPTTKLLMNDISETSVKGGKTTEVLPVFRYYRYYRESDAGAVYGELDPTPIAGELTESEAARVARVTIAFTMNPEGDEGFSYGGGFGIGRPVTFEDSAILRVAPSSSSSIVSNLPCENQV